MTDEEALTQIRKTLEDFPKFFPEHKDKELYGILAAANMPQTIAGQARKAGIYTASMNDNVVKLNVPGNFRPRSWRKK